MFNPKEIIFAVTSKCNLMCSHCYVSKNNNVINVKEAKNFLNQCSHHEINKVGFSGGEPFLAFDELADIVEEAIINDYTFDRLMTNAVWYNNINELKIKLSKLYNVGYDGIFGISFDSYHGQTSAQIALFIQNVFEIWDNKECVEIISVLDDNALLFCEKLETIATSIGGYVEYNNAIPVYIKSKANVKTAAFGENLCIKIITLNISKKEDNSVWDSDQWFKEDYCDGPGNVFYVHPTGDVAVCCGFANENTDLIIGNIKTHSYNELMDNAYNKPYVTACYNTGLETVRKKLQANGYVFNGKTNDYCMFCDYICKKKLL